MPLWLAAAAVSLGRQSNLLSKEDLRSRTLCQESILASPASPQTPHRSRSTSVKCQWWKLPLIAPHTRTAPCGPVSHRCPVSPAHAARAPQALGALPLAHVTDQLHSTWSSFHGQKKCRFMTPKRREGRENSIRWLQGIKEKKNLVRTFCLKVEGPCRPGSALLLLALSLVVAAEHTIHCPTHPLPLPSPFGVAIGRQTGQGHRRRHLFIKLAFLLV